MGETGSRRGRERIGGYLRQISILGGEDPAGTLPYRPQRLYRVSEIAEHLGITRQTIHNYATIGLITEEDRTPGGQRLFDESVFDRLFLIQRLKPMHRLSEIRRLLAEQNRPRPQNPADRDAAGATPPPQGPSPHAREAGAVDSEIDNAAPHQKENRNRDEHQT
jgi:DNA-binding transcriptional MerR regulator